MMGQRKNTRGRIEILASILFHCREGIKKTQIMCKANLGYEQITFYLPNLIHVGLVEQVIESSYVVYKTTNSGREFLRFYFGMIKLLGQVECMNLTSIKTAGRDNTFHKICVDEINSTTPLISILDETEN